MNVESLMSTDVARCGPETPMAEAAQSMWEHDCGFLPVVEDGDRLRGVVTDRDICMAAGMKRAALGETTVREAMSPKVATVQADDEVATVHEKMRESRVRRLPVVDDQDHVVGVVSLNDLCLAATEAGQPEAEHQRQEVLTTLAHVSEHRPQAPLR